MATVHGAACHWDTDKPRTCETGAVKHGFENLEGSLFPPLQHKNVRCKVQFSAALLPSGKMHPLTRTFSPHTLSCLLCTLLCCVLDRACYTPRCAANGVSVDLCVFVGCVAVLLGAWWRWARVRCGVAALVRCVDGVRRGGAARHVRRAVRVGGEWRYSCVGPSRERCATRPRTG